MYEWQAIKSMRNETIIEVSKELDLECCSKCKCDCGYVKIVSDIAKHILTVREVNKKFGLVK